MKWVITKLFLAPLIRRNYALRRAHKIPDQWYWADKIAFKWGYWIDYDPNPLFCGKLRKIND